MWAEGLRLAHELLAAVRELTAELRANRSSALDLIRELRELRNEREAA